MKPPSERLRILVLGYVVRCPLGGMAWHYLQYALGLAQLGHDVFFLEDSDDYAETCYDPVSESCGPDPSYGLRFAARLFDRVGLGERWAYRDQHANCWRGPQANSADELCKSADMLINVSGSNPARDWFEHVPIRVYIDTDPCFEQVRQLTNPARAARAAAHNRFFTFGENITATTCAIPETGVSWLPTRQPLVLDQWRVQPLPATTRFTTVMQWDSYDPVEYGGVGFGMKSRSFIDYLDLPGLVDAEFELALGSASAPREQLKAKGWQLHNPLKATADAWTYQDYIHGSLGEFSVAKHGYVVSNSGWFSERTAAYLASGRPVIVQDTGFKSWMDESPAVLPFSTLEEAAEHARRVVLDPQPHHRAARHVAERYFDARPILTELVESATRSETIASASR